MEVPKNSYACAICQKRFNNPIILIKHVEFRHSSTKQSSKADNLKDGNQDPLETKNSKESNEEIMQVESLPPSLPPTFEYVAIQESVKIESHTEVTEKETNVPTNCQVSESIGIKEPVDRNEIFQFETNNTANIPISTDKRVFVKQTDIRPKPNSLQSSHEVKVKAENISPEKDQGELALHKSEEHEKFGLYRPPKIHPVGKIYECGICHKKVKRPQNIKEHLMIHTGEQPFKCSVCDKKFARLQNLKVHERIHTGEKPYNCGYCDKKFRLNQNHKMHERLHTGEKPYDCGNCDKKFTQWSGLKSHEKTHTGEKPYICDICDKTFSLSGNLSRHKKLHTNGKPFECGVCNKNYRNSYDLKSHEWTHNGVKPYECDICDKKFTQSHSLKDHKRTHTGEKPYVCGYCDKKSSTFNGIKSHERTHTGEVPYKCGICDKRFAQTQSLKMHKMIHTGDKPYECGSHEKNPKSSEYQRTFGERPNLCKRPRKTITNIQNIQNLPKKMRHDKTDVAESLENIFCKPCALQFNSIAVFQMHQKLVHDQRQLKTEIEPENCDQTTDDIDNQNGKLGSNKRETKENAKGKENSTTKEYFDLPYGWRKEVVSIKNQPSMKGKVREDIYLISPGRNGKKIQSDIKLHLFLEEYPNIKCDLEVTSTSRVKHREFLMNQKNL